MKATIRFLLTFSLLSRNWALDDDIQSVAEIPCHARAWVRAPNLEPGQVVQGDVRVKLDGRCPNVSSYSLGLRFVERSWVKTRREGAMLPERPQLVFPRLWGSGDSVYDIGGSTFMFGNEPTVNNSSWEQYESDMKDPTLWLVREEERIGFETKYSLRNDQQASNDVVEPFAILIPSTNYPPGFDRSTGASIEGEADFADSEHIYAYFVEVKFTNGTLRQIPAGCTSFNAVIEREPLALETVNVTATRQRSGRSSSEPKSATLQDEFTLEVTFPNGRNIEQGSNNNISIVTHQLGPGLQRLLDIRSLYPRVSQKRRWAANFAADNETAAELLDAGYMYESQLWPEPDGKSLRYSHSWRDDSLQFAQEGAVENGTVFTTDAVNAQFRVPHRCYPPFETYYQTTEVDLVFMLSVRNLSYDEDELKQETIEDDEYHWIPTLRGTKQHRAADVLHASIPISVHPKSEDSEAFTSLKVEHYLSPDARAPIFVDPSSVTELLRKTVKDRDALAPIAQAEFVAHADADVVKHRYHGGTIHRARPSGLYYVGDTWLRKVVRGADKDATPRVGPLVVQA